VVFYSPVVDGDTLIRNAMQSLGFVAGSTGWRIGRDGSSEFNNSTVRGDLIVGSPATGEAEVSSTVPAAITTHVGTVYGANVAHVWIGLIDTAGNYAYLAEGDFNGVHGHQPVLFVGVLNTTSGKFTDLVQLYGDDNASDGVDIVNIGQNADLVAVGFNANQFPTDPNFTTPCTLFQAPRVYISSSSDLRYGNANSNGSISLSRGRIANQRFSGAPFSSTLGAGVETAMATGATGVYRNGRAYEVHWYGNMDSTVAQTVQPKIRQNTVGGTVLYNGPVENTVAGGADVYWQRTAIFVNTSCADISANLCLTFTGSSATAANLTGTGVDASFVTVEDVGEASAYPGYASLT